MLLKELDRKYKNVQDYNLAATNQLNNMVVVSPLVEDNMSSKGMK